MKFLFNCTTNIVGGGLKNSKLFIDRLLDDAGKNNSWHLAIHRSYLKWFSLDDFPPDMAVLVLDRSPARSLRARKELLCFQQENDFDCVYTMAGPAYVKFSCPHIMGISNPYLYLATKFEFSFGLSVFQQVKRRMRARYQRLHATSADYFCFQTPASLEAFRSGTGVSSDRCKIIPNAVDRRAAFHKEAQNRVPLLFCPSPSYSHKGHVLLPAISKALEQFTRHSIVVLIDGRDEIGRKVISEAEKLGVLQNFVFLGRVEYSSMNSLYKESDAILIPTVLETFTVTFYEAFQAEKPAVVFDLPFAREACGSAALFVDYMDPPCAALGIWKVLDDKRASAMLVAEGRKLVEAAIDHDERFRLIVDSVEELTEIAAQN